MSSLFEKKWPSVICPTITVADSIITVTDTFGLHPKQQITILKTGFEPLEAEIKRVLSRTQIQIGPIGKQISTYWNPTDYSGGSLIASEQERNAIDSNAGLRAAYAEEPTVALRNALVDYYGCYIGSAKDSEGNNRLLVDANIQSTSSNWDRIELGRDECTSNLTNIKYYLDTVLQRELALTYDIDGDLIVIEEV